MHIKLTKIVARNILFLISCSIAFDEATGQLEVSDTGKPGGITDGGFKPSILQSLHCVGKSRYFSGRWQILIEKNHNSNDENYFPSGVLRGFEKRTPFTPDHSLKYYVLVT